VADLSHLDEDERRLAELGYKQELSRSWSGFSNFAISFSIISILAGCFTTFGQAWTHGGPIAISIGWPLISAFILIVGLCMSELVSAYPTAGGIYWWAAKLSGPKAGYYTGWLNLIGLLAVQASVAYGCATFLDLTVSTYSESYAAGYSLGRVFVIFIVVMALVSVINIFSAHLMSIMNNISVWWHVIGAAVVILILAVLPKSHQSVGYVFTERLNGSGFFEGNTGGFTFFFFVLPLGFLLTQYTITGFDASAHLSEETRGAAEAAAKGLWRSIFYAAIGGWFLLLAFLFAINDPEAVTAAGGSVAEIFQQALPTGWATTVLGIAAIGQFFCSMACMTSASRMVYAFSRDGAVPGSRLWARLNHNRVPVYAVMFSAGVAVAITLPALANLTAFFAVVSVAVIGLYLAFAIPIWLRLRAGDSFKTGSWNLGKHYKWMCWVAVVEIAIISVYFIMPTSPEAVPFTSEFDISAVNYAPVLTVGALIVLWIFWHLSVKNWFTGPKTTIDLPVGVSAADELELEHESGEPDPIP
jgi:amino acid transporter